MQLRVVVVLLLLAVVVAWCWRAPATVTATTKTSVVDVGSARANRRSALPTPHQIPAALSGRVLDPDGGTVPGARVVIARVAESLEPGIVLAVLHSDGDGLFRLPSVGLAGRVMVSATARGWAGGSTATQLGATNVDAHVNVRLARGGGVFFGRITDGPDSPVVATITAYGVDDTAYQVECDADGRYELGLPAGAWSLAFRADGYAPSLDWKSQLLAERQRIQIDLDLRPETAVRLHVVDDEDRPAIGAVVISDNLAVGITDGSGDFVLHNPSDDSSVEVRMGSLVASESLHPPAVGESTVEIQLRAGYALNGKVAGPEGDIAGAVVICDGDVAHPKISGSDGTFAFVGMTRGVHDIEARVGDIRRGRDRVVVRRRSREPSTVWVEAAARIRLTVRDERGPVAGVRVWADQRLLLSTDGRGQCEWSASSGAAEVVDPRTGRLHFLKEDPTTDGSVTEIALALSSSLTQGSVVYSDGTAAAGIEVIIAGSVLHTDASGHFEISADAGVIELVELNAFVIEENNHRYVIARASERLSGRVVDGDGRPVWGAEVRATPQSSFVEYGEMPWVRTGADGRFAINRLAKGLYGVVVRHVDFAELTLIDQPTSQDLVAALQAPEPPESEDTGDKEVIDLAALQVAGD